MKDSFLALVEVQEVPSEFYSNDVFQQTITAWLTTQLNTTHTNDACTELSAQAFKIISCVNAAHKVS